MIKGILKIIIYIGFIAFILGIGIYTFNFTPLINNFNNIFSGDLLIFFKDFVLLFFENQYIMLFLTITILIFIFNKLF